MSVELSDEHNRLDLKRVAGWLATAYWSPGVSRDLVERAAAVSAVTGAYDGGGQVGYCRLVTDQSPSPGWPTSGSPSPRAGRASVACCSST